SNVIATDEWPSLSLTILGWTPCCRSCVAWLCRMSWSRTPWSPWRRAIFANCDVKESGSHCVPSSDPHTRSISVTSSPNSFLNTSCATRCSFRASTAISGRSMWRPCLPFGGLYRICPFVCSVEATTLYFFAYSGTRGRDVIGVVEADKLFDRERIETEVSVRQARQGGASTRECIS